jgi:K+-transporting ATPase ATPase C chain
MDAHVRANALLLSLTLLLCSVLYPLAVLAFGHALVPFQAGGSLIGADGEPAAPGQAVGSLLIAQGFEREEYFQPRPSAASYDGAASAGSNWAASNPSLRDRAARQLGLSVPLFPKHAPVDREWVPADAVTASGSGLDPHITLRNARQQLDRVVSAWASKTGTDPERIRSTVNGILDQHTFVPLGGLGGEPIVNVLEVNLALRSKLSIS